ncbi:MAG: hypothetical protein M1814_004447 [Vezdaea aestivalis]|nr:MAG: hypothetical protein M1814_004447 [Vezdaea aestivalis]
MALTLASLICIILVGAGTTNKSSTALSNLYFFGADTSGFKSNQADILKNTKLDDELRKLLSANATKDLEDFYIVGLFSYCDGDKEGDTYQVKQCSKPVASYWFNPLETFGLNNSGLASKYPEKLQKGLDAYRNVSKWMFIAYVVAFVATLVEIVVGILAVCSRWGSMVTTIVSCVSSVFIFVASLTATLTFSILAASFNTVFKPYNIKAHVGGPMLATTWLAVAFSFGAGVFWLLSTCCCSGKSSSPAHRGTKAEKTPYTYERVASPFGGQASHGGQSVPLQPYKAQAYEPYSHK